MLPLVSLWMYSYTAECFCSLPQLAYNDKSWLLTASHVGVFTLWRVADYSHLSFSAKNLLIKRYQYITFEFCMLYICML